MWVPPVQAVLAMPQYLTEQVELPVWLRAAWLMSRSPRMNLNMILAPRVDLNAVEASSQLLAQLEEFEEVAA